MFESNFPPDKESCSYRTLYNAFKRMAAALELTAEEKADIFHDTALRACECFAASVHCTARYMYLLPHRALGHRADPAPQWLCADRLDDAFCTKL